MCYFTIYFKFYFNTNTSASQSYSRCLPILTIVPYSSKRINSKGKKDSKQEFCSYWYKCACIIYIRMCEIAYKGRTIRTTNNSNDNIILTTGTSNNNDNSNSKHSNNRTNDRPATGNKKNDDSNNENIKKQR